MPKNLTDVDTFTAPIVVPVGGDGFRATGAELAFQGLANRTRNLDTRLDTIEAYEVLDEWTYPTPKARVRIVSAFAAHGLPAGSGDPVAWSESSGVYLESEVNDARLVLDLAALLPPGAVLTEVRALVTPGAARAGGSRMWLGWYSAALSFTSPSQLTSGPFDAVEDNGAASIQVLTVTPASPPTISKSAGVQTVVLRGGADGATNRDLVHGFRLSYTDPGPRNL